MNAKRQPANIVFFSLFGSFLFVLGAANLWGGAGFTMALGFALLFLAHFAVTVRGKFSPPSRTMIERIKRNKQIAEAVKVGDRIELPSFIQEPPIQWEPVEVIGILPQARDGYVRVQVRHANGTESTASLDQLWNAHPLNRLWRPLTS
jgi:hypothetical protein